MLAAVLTPVPHSARGASRPDPPVRGAGIGGRGDREPEPTQEAKPRLAAAPQVIPFPANRQPDSAAEGVELPEEIVNLIVDRVVRRMSPDVIRDVAWEVIPELAEIIIRQIINEKGLPPQVTAVTARGAASLRSTSGLLDSNSEFA